MQKHNSPDIASACPFVKADHVFGVVVVMGCNFPLGRLVNYSSTNSPILIINSLAGSIMLAISSSEME